MADAHEAHPEVKHDYHLVDPSPWPLIGATAAFVMAVPRVVQLHHRYGMILFIASEVMFFVAWFWAYFDASLYPNDPLQVQRVETLGGTWPPKGIETFDPWHLPLFNTLILLTSGTTVTWAHHALLHGDRQGVKWGLWLTIALGFLFTCVQAYE